MKPKRWLLPLQARAKTFINLLAHGYFSRAANYLLANINMVRKPDYVSHYPLILVIDPGNVCNLACVHCITGQKKSARPPRLLTFKNFKKILKQLGKWAVQVDLYNWGEPFLNQETVAMIAYAKKFGLRVETSSNLLLLTPKLARQIVNLGLDRLIVSLHGATPKTTAIFMKGGDFKRAIDNLQLLIKTKRRLKSRRPSITWRYVVSRYNEGELKTASKLAQKLGVDSFEPVPLKLEPGFDPDVLKERVKKRAGWLPKKKEYLLYDPATGQPINRTFDCFWPWEIIAVNSDGTIQPCCIFSNPAYDFGNLLKTPFGEIWNSVKYQTARKVIREKIKTDKSTLCGLCVANNFLAR